MGDLIIIIGRTSSGKDTLAAQIISDKRTQILSHTTRPRRENEGETHTFIDSIDDFPHRWVETEINGNHYFILEEDVTNHDILVIDPIGLYSLLAQPRFTRPYRIYYIDVDESIRCQRYMKRDNTTKEAFIARNASEDEQFTEFEDLIADPRYRKMNHLTVLQTQDDIDAVAKEINAL